MGGKGPHRQRPGEPAVPWGALQPHTQVRMQEAVQQCADGRALHPPPEGVRRVHRHHVERQHHTGHVLLGGAARVRAVHARRVHNAARRLDLPSWVRYRQPDLPA